MLEQEMSLTFFPFHDIMLLRVERREQHGSLQIPYKSIGGRSDMKNNTMRDDMMMVGLDVVMDNSEAYPEIRRGTVEITDIYERENTVWIAYRYVNQKDEIKCLPEDIFADHVISLA